MALPNVQKRESAVETSWPDADFVCLQEVWDRASAVSLIRSLRTAGFQDFVFELAETQTKSIFRPWRSELDIKV